MSNNNMVRAHHTTLQVCPACRRTTRNLVQHLLGHMQPLSGYASCASSASQPSTSRATCQSLVCSIRGQRLHLAHTNLHLQDWGRAACCSERSFVTTTADGEEEGGPPLDLDALSQLDAHSVLSGSDVAELLSLTDLGPPTPQPSAPSLTTSKVWTCWVCVTALCDDMFVQ